MDWLHNSCCLGSPTLHSGGTKSEWAHKWADWLCHTSHLVPNTSERGGGVSYVPEMGGLATYSCRLGPPTPKGGYKSAVAHKWPDGLHQPCRPRVTMSSKRGRISNSPQVGGWATNHCRLGVPKGLEAGEISSGPQVAGLATPPLPPHKWVDRLCHPYRVCGSPTPRSAEQNQQWPSSGRIGHEPLPSGGSHRLESGGESVVAHKWPDGLHHPCRLWVPTASEQGLNQQRPTSGQIGYTTPAVCGLPMLQSEGGGG